MWETEHLSISVSASIYLPSFELMILAEQKPFHMFPSDGPLPGLQEEVETEVFFLLFRSFTLS